MTTAIRPFKSRVGKKTVHVSQLQGAAEDNNNNLPMADCSESRAYYNRLTGLDIEMAYIDGAGEVPGTQEEEEQRKIKGSRTRRKSVSGGPPTPRSGRVVGMTRRVSDRSLASLAAEAGLSCGTGSPPIPAGAVLLPAKARSRRNSITAVTEGLGSLMPESTRSRNFMTVQPKD